MFALGKMRFVMAGVFAWPLAAARNDHREMPVDASTELDAVLRYDIGLSDINVAKIRRRPSDPMEYSRSVEGMCQRLL